MKVKIITLVASLVFVFSTQVCADTVLETIGKAVDISDKNSAIRRIGKGADISNPNSDVRKAGDKVVDGAKEVATTAVNVTAEIIKDPINGACGSPFMGYVSSVNITCAIDNGSSGSGNIYDAKKLLVDHGFYSWNDFDRVKFQWCSPLKIGANGMVTAPNTISLDRSYRHETANILAPLIGHEMVHIKQVRRLGFAEFACKYSGELPTHGWSCGSISNRRGNFLECEAYKLGDRIERDLSESQNTTSVISSTSSMSSNSGEVIQPNSSDSAFGEKIQAESSNSGEAIQPDPSDSAFGKKIQAEPSKVIVPTSVESKNNSSLEEQKPKDNMRRIEEKRLLLEDMKRERQALEQARKEEVAARVESDSLKKAELDLAKRKLELDEQYRREQLEIEKKRDKDAMKIEAVKALGELMRGMQGNRQSQPNYSSSPNDNNAGY